MSNQINKITALYCRLSQEDENKGEKLTFRLVKEPKVEREK